MNRTVWLIFSLVSLGYHVNGHGAMYFPNPWWATSECSGNPEECSFMGNVPNEGNCEGRCRAGAGLVAWFTNYTSVPERTIEKEYLTQGLTNKGPLGLHPWNSPGSAKIFGNGCGVNGGNPNGCLGEDNVFGRCCGGSWKGNGSGGRIWESGCGGYVGGKPALRHYKDGLFAQAQTTTWERGTNATVMWESKAYHRGGYAYRLCRVRRGKTWKVNERCFRRGHLKFASDTTWTYYASRNGPWDPENWEANPIVKTNVGTNPPGSEWVKVNLPKDKVGSEKWAFKDLVEVPESLKPGQYVLSFRWDCQQSPQVWNSCANIDIV